MRLIFLAIIFLPLVSYSQKPFAVVELFTSEGCSSCPPADALLNKIKADAEKSMQNIITLAYHVDYWNKLGWKDPYSKFQYTIRQENYSRVLPGKEMYTPQAIVNGKISFIGSKKEMMNEGIKEALSKNSLIDLKIKIDSVRNDSLFISYALTRKSNDYVLRLALTEDGLTSKVGKGENSGKTLYHDSVVRFFTSIDSPSANGNAIIRSNVFTGKGPRELIGFIQHKQNMTILGADKIRIK